MKQILKRTISLLLCVALLLGYVPAVVFAAETKTVYYYNAASNWSSVSVYYWGSANDPGWPGNAMTNLGNGYWSAEVPTGITGIIFNNGNNGKQTRDLSLPTDSKNCYAGGSWIVYTGDAVEIKKATVYVDATACGWTNVNAYYWGGSDSCMWPGTPMTLVADGVYAIEISEDTIYIIFNNGTDHTNDLTFPGDGYIYNGNDWSLYEECAHEYESVVTAPTCAVDGYTTHTCSKCGDSYTDSKVAALGHSYTEGVCMVCGYVGEIVINITDSYGDGWNGNAIEVYENDNLVLTATMTNGKNASVSVPCINGRAYTFKWVKGSYAGECSFEIKVNDETAFSATTNDCGEYANSEQLYKLCNHSYGEGVQTEPTCTEKGGLVYTCSVCGNKRIEGEIPALGHSYVEGVCTVCGAEDITIYVQPNSNWLSGNARFAAYFFGNGEMWVDCVDTGNGLYAVEVPEGFTYVIFCRMDPSTTDNSWIKKWNQTKDLEVPTDDKVVYVVDGWDNGAGQWIEFGGEPVEPEVVYYLRGSMNGWGDGNPMTKNADGTWTVTIALEAGEYEYKAVVADWATSYPSGVNAVVTVEKACDVTFVLDIAKGEITAECEKVECEHEYESVVTAPTCAVDGYTTHTCSKCGDSYTDSKVAATGHSVSGDACVNCGKAASEIIVDSGTCGDNLTWTLSAVGTLTISGTGDMDGFDYGSTPWYNYSEVITNVLVENGVTSIGDYAFSECSYLAYVSLPVGLTYMRKCVL